MDPATSIEPTISPGAPSTLLTFLFADVRGYTRFTNERGDEAAARLCARFSTLARETVITRGGEVIELRGDEALAVFGSARNAMRAALDLQERFAEATEADPTLPLPVGIGLDAGESIPMEGGYRGGALNLAARLCSQAGPGEVLASAGVIHLARRTEGIVYVERGEVALKGLPEPIRVVQIVTEASAALDLPLPPLSNGTLPTTSFVFLCYAHADAAFAARLSADLQASGLTCWTDQRGLKPGTADWEQTVRDAIRACQAIVLVASRDSRQSRYVKAELSVAEMYQRPVYPLWAAGEEWIDCIPLGLSAMQYTDARGALYNAALTAVVQNLSPKVEPPSPSSEGSLQPRSEPASLPPVGEPRNPYKGLRPFIAEDASDFFGRSGVIDELVVALGGALEPGTPSANRLLAVVGPSGSGKSSVVMAGLLPRLQQSALPHSDEWIYLGPIVPGNHPVEALTVALADKLDHSMRAIQDDLDADSSRGLHLLACQLARRSEARVVIMIDQFEEVFTQVADETERQQFVDLLVTAATEPRGPVIVILTVRADFYHQSMRYPELWRILESRTRAIAPMSVDELHEVIEQPARLPDTQLTFEGDLVGDLLFDLYGQEGALPLLQFTLDQLFERRDGRCLTMAAYRDLGGVRGALARHAEATYEHLPSAEHRMQARALFLRLIEPGASEQDMTRRRLDMSELILHDAQQTTVLGEAATAFVDARLLISNEVGGVRTLEVGHEALIRSWPRLYGWVQEDRGGLLVHRRLTEAALEWQREQDEGILYRGTRLAALQEWLQRTDSTALNELEGAFVRSSTELTEREEQEREERQQHELEAAQALAQSERRRARVARSLSGILALVLVAALVTASYALQQSHQAQLERDITKSHDIAASALGQVKTNPELAVLLAIEAARFSPTIQAEDALRQVLTYSPVRAVMRGHTQTVNMAAFNPSGTQVVTASSDKTARLWEARTGKVIATLRGHTNGVNTASFSPDGKLIVTSSDDGTARVWDAGTHLVISMLRGHAAGVSSATFSSDSRLVVTTGQDDTARVWQARSGHLVSVLRGHTDSVNSAAFSPDNRLVVTASTDHTARVWNARTGTLLRVLHGHTDYVNGASFSPNGRLIVTASSDQTARLWDADTGKPIALLSGHTGAVNSAAFSPNGALIVTASDDNTARVWDGHTGQPMVNGAHGPVVLRGHTASVSSAVFNRDGTLIVTASSDNTARVWKAQTGQPITTLRGHTNVVNTAVFSADGTYVVTAGDTSARVWRTSVGPLQAVLAGDSAAVNSATFSPDGSRIVTAAGGDSPTGDNSARVWDARSGRMLSVLRGHVYTVKSATFSPDGSLIVTTSEDGTARVWRARTGALVMIASTAIGFYLTNAEFNPASTRVDVATQNGEIQVDDVRTGKRLSTFLTEPRVANPSAFSPDATLMVAASSGHAARIWQVGTGHLVRILRGQANQLSTAEFSPDGSHLVAACADDIVRVWDVHTGMVVAALRGHTGPVNSAAFSPDGTLIVTASADATARVWDAHTGALVAILRGHSGAVNEASFSPDGALVVTAGQDGTARVWNAATGGLITTLRGHIASLNTAVFSPDGKLIVTASNDNTARVFSCDACGSLPELLTLARTRVTRQLTPAERASYL